MLWPCTDGLACFLGHTGPTCPGPTAEASGNALTSQSRTPSVVTAAGVYRLLLAGAGAWWGMGDLHRSFSSRVPLEVTDSAWMNSENSILPS